MARLVIVWLARAVLLVVAAALFTSTLSHIWTDMRFSMHKHFDKIAHFLAMFTMTLVGVFALPEIRAYWVFAITISVAAIIELAQIVGPRSADTIDFLMSVAGVLFFALAYYAAAVRKKLGAS